MKFTLLTIGKIKNQAIQELVDDYALRLQHYIKLELLIAKTEQAALAKISSREAVHSDMVWLCDERGEQFSSKDLAAVFNKHQLFSNKMARRLVFVIGDANGHGDQMKARADKLISFSKMTFPHEIAQVILLEQLYRAFTIIKGEKYHKE